MGEPLGVDGSPPLPLVAGRYELVALMGVGGMGSVYRARDRELDELVALKMLRRELVAQPGIVERFRREVKLARRVTHKNVARVFDIGEHEGEKFITMELIEGESLGARLGRETRLPLAEVLSISRAILEGLGAAHSAGVVHRDLKPDNVLVEATGRIVLSDFGIARAAAFGGPPSKTLGFVVGTPDYMAPEQIERPADIDARADLYAFGVMLFEMVTGEMPFKGESPLAIVTARLLGPPPDPATIMPDVPDPLRRLILQLLARSPDERPASATAVSALLAAIPVPARAARRFESLKPPMTFRASQPLAVIPLAASPERLAWLGYGISELVADALDGRHGVDIRARGARLADLAHRDLAELGDILGVPLVIGGRLEETESGEVRGSVELVNARDGIVVWYTNFGNEARTRPLGFANVIAQAAASRLLLGERAVAIASGADEDAVTLCLQAHFEAARRDGADRAIALYERAIARAPRDPWVNASYALALARRIGEAELPGEVDDVISMAQLAAEHAPGLPAPHIALAEIHLDRGRHEEAAKALALARSRAPSNAAVERLVARILLDVGEVDEALSQLRSASEREAGSWRSGWDEVRAFAAVGKSDRAEAAVEAAAECEPQAARAWLSRVRLALWTRNTETLAALDRQVQAAVMGDKALVSSVIAAALGRTSLAAALAHVETHSRAAGPSSARRAFLGELAVELAMATGDPGKAAAVLARVADEVGCDLVWLDRCSLVRPLEETTAFARLRAAARTRAQKVKALLRARPDTEPKDPTL